MQAPVAPFPDLQSLTSGLASVLGGSGYKGGPVTVLDREPNSRMGTFPTEIVTCRTGGGSELRLFCKYAAGRGHNVHGHRSGVAYEAEVYERVLRPLPLPAPCLFGTHADGTAEGMWLVLGYLDDSVRVRETRKPAALDQSAGWIGRFHAANEGRVSSPALRFLNTYDGEYYVGWARRTFQFAGLLHHSLPWLATLCRRFEETVAELLAAPATVIHGEYYPKNILFRDGTAYPVDWESAAIAAGEIDLASLTDGCHAPVVRQCEREYQKARWPTGPPPTFARTLDVARLYVQFRWLGDRPEWTTRPTRRWRFEHLRSAAERLGLV